MATLNPLLEVINSSSLLAKSSIAAPSTYQLPFLSISIVVSNPCMPLQSCLLLQLLPPAAHHHRHFSLHHSHSSPTSCNSFPTCCCSRTSRSSRENLSLRSHHLLHCWQFQKRSTPFATTGYTNLSTRSYLKTTVLSIQSSVITWSHPRQPCPHLR